MAVPLKERHPNVALPIPGQENAVLKENEPKQLKLYKYARGDDKVSVEFTRGSMLGKGAFAVCYELMQPSTSQIYAGKITAKAKLKNENARRKLLLEVKLHKELRHPHIVAVHALYEDEENYYMVMEKCNGKTLRDIVRRKKRLEENEAKIYMLQLLDALEYLQKLNIVHRDMKLDNIFMHDNQVKLGDFGLAVKLQPNEKKQTMCGTPNYIAPEVLARTGHGLEVDNWAVGVILYALLIGTPPFETKAVETTYEKIRNIEYYFPAEFPISEDAKDVIRRILVPEPDKRLSVQGIRNHRFFSLAGSLRPPLQAIEGPLAFSSQNIPAASAFQMRAVHQEHDSSPTERGMMTRKRRRESLLATVATEEGLGQRAAPDDHNASPNPQSRKRKRQSEVDAAAEGEKRPATADRVQALRTAGEDARFNSQIIQSPSKRVREQYKTLSSRTMNEPRMIKELHDHIESFIAQLRGQKTSPSRRSQRAQSVSPVLRKHVWVVKWVDYSQKYGLGYQFCDGTIGVSFNDASKMVLSTDCTSVEFHRVLSTDSSTSAGSSTQLHQQKFSKSDIAITGTLSEAAERCSDPFTRKRLALLNYFREYLNKSSKSPGLDAKPLMLDGGRDDEMPEQASILHWIRTQDGIVFLMSDFSAQCNFYDHHKIVVDRNLESITFVDALGLRTVMTVAQALANPVPELADRLKYLANCIRSFWMEKQPEPLAV